MAHYAFIDNDGLVVEVITGVDEDQVVNGITGSEGWEQFYATMRPGLTCKRTSLQRSTFAKLRRYWLHLRQRTVMRSYHRNRTRHGR
jgi:hypothetical protein